MSDIFELGFELNQNFFDFLALEVKTYLEYLGISSPDEPAPVQNQFFAKGSFKTISWENYPSPHPSSAVNAYYDYDITIVGDNNPFSALSIPRLNRVERDYSSTTNQQLQEWENYLKNYRSWYTFAPSSDFSPPAHIRAYTSDYSDAFITDSTWNRSVWDIDTPYNSNLTAHKINVRFSNSTPIWSYTERNFFYIRDNTLYLTADVNSNIFTTSDAVKYKLIDLNIGGSSSSYTQKSFTTDSGDTINYYYRDGSLIFPASQYELSFNDYSRLFNDYSSDTNNTISFPTWDDLQGEYYIQKMHEYNYDLQLPDTSDYLDTAVISEPLSIISDTFDYLWSNITALGFAPVLGFCLVATLIVKGLRGD